MKNNKSRGYLLAFILHGEKVIVNDFSQFKKTSDFYLTKITKWCILNIQRIMQFV